MKNRQWLTYVLLLVLASCSYLPEDKTIQEYATIQDETRDYIFLSSSTEVPDKAFLFVPGGFVDPHVYLCWMDRFVETYPDIAIISAKIPSNLAILGQKKIKEIMNDFPGVGHWIIGGHSLGGIVSTALVKGDPEAFDAIVLMASWAASSYDLSSWEGSVLSIFASNDGLATPAEIEENKQFLPPEISVDSSLLWDPNEPGTVYWEIEGGNHSGFGCYGLQQGDGVSTISNEEQQELIISAISKFCNLLWQ